MQVEPKIALVVMRMIQSCGLMILGSGTVSTLTFSFPFQQRAFTIDPPMKKKPAASLRA